MIGGLLAQHTVAMEVMSSKVELLLEPPKLSQEDIDTEVRKKQILLDSVILT